MVAWTLVFHIIGLVFWLGSLLVVTQILAIHTEETSPETRATLGRLESKLLKGLAHPGAAIMVITGFILVSHDPNYLRDTGCTPNCFWWSFWWRLIFGSRFEQGRFRRGRSS